MKTYKTPLKRYKLVAEPTDFPKVKITSSKDAYEVIKKFYHEDREIYESFFALYLNRQNNTIGFVKIGQGGIAGVAVDTSLVLKYAIESLSTSIIVAHNHPSGQLIASDADLKITENIKRASKYFGISIIDHLILAGDSDNYLSFADDGML